MRFVAKHDNLRVTGRLHALVHIFVARSDAQAKLRIPFRGNEAVYEDRLAILRSALVCKQEMLWRLAKLKNLRGIDWLNLVL